ncbi:PTR2 domain-containing protein [Cephalotus follicularis]|uniref:PTR2 domain-containing protein n=1 Tax=Cephalotus follicularis TaxID=3775 RepID=A0A1Q3D5Q6_CEPFO|nr:PTR2 domain-containing protein [Cephalotus follicularis]
MFSLDFSLLVGPQFPQSIKRTPNATSFHQQFHKVFSTLRSSLRNPIQIKLKIKMEEAHQLTTWEGYVDWRNKPAMRGHHGGMLAASFVLVVEVLENLAYLGNASNLVLYLSKIMHFSPSTSANIVTDFMGTAFLLALLGGFLADAFFTSYIIYLISAAIEFLGLLILTAQAHIHSLKPSPCVLLNTRMPCQEVDDGKAAMLFAGLYLVALGVGGIKGSLPSHGAEQFDENTPHGRRQRSTFFNYYVFCLSCGALIAVTFVVWIEDNKGWQWGFGISTATILISIPIFLLGSPTYKAKVPRGSPITTMFKVLAVAIYNSCTSRSPSSGVMVMDASLTYTTETSKGEDDIAKEEVPNQTPTESLNCLNIAAIRKPVHPLLRCTVKKVEEVKIVLKILPIFMSTIMLNCCLAQLSTFSVQQASTMNTKLGSLKVPPASLPVVPVIFIMIVAPLYNHVIVPFAIKITKTEMGITHLQRIGTGLLLSIVAMAVAAVVEIKRRRVAVESGLLNSTDPLPITFLWVALQYLFLGSADLFTLAGMMDFFFTEAPISMRSLATALSWASLAIGYYLSSVLVQLVSQITRAYGQTPWLFGSNLNHYHLERFYWLMCILSSINFLSYLFWAHRYNYKSTSPHN